MLDLITVSFHEEHVAVAVNANVPELNVSRVGATGLLKVSSGAVVVRCVIGGLRGEHEDRLLGKVDELAGRWALGLQDAIGAVIPRAGEYLLLQVRGGVVDGR